jgi:hypothetical protein
MADVPQQDRDLKLPRTQIGNRWVTKYDPALAMKIVEKISEGETLKRICTPENGMPHWTTFHKWVARCPQLRAAYEAAQILSAMHDADEATDTAREVWLSPGTAQKVRAADILIKQLQWSAGVKNPAVFGNKAGNNVMVPIQIITTLDLGEGSAGQTKDYPDIYSYKANPDPASPEVVQEAKDVLGIKDPTQPLLMPPKSSYDPKAPRKRVLTPTDPDYKLDLTDRKPDGRTV